MNKDHNHILFSVTSIIFLSFAGVIILHEASAWTGPTLTPPNGNTPPALNTGSANQTKTGGLTLGGELWLKNSARFISQGGGMDWTIDNLADTLTFSAGASQVITVNSVGDLTVTGSICDSGGTNCIGTGGTTYTAGTGISIAGGVINADAEIDPEVGSLVGGQWCTSDGSQINCTSAAPTGGTTYTAGTGISISAAGVINADAEIDPNVNALGKTILSSCTADQIVQFDGNVWVCVNGVHAVYAP